MTYHIRGGQLGLDSSLLEGGSIVPNRWAVTKGLRKEDDGFLGGQHAGIVAKREREMFARLI